MANSYISSFITEIHPTRADAEAISLDHNFASRENPDKVDVIDMLERALQANPLWRDNQEIPIAEVPDQAPQPRGVPTTNKKMKLSRICQKGIYRNDDNINIFKYLYFQVEYGESGSNFNVEAADGTTFHATSDDFQNRLHYVFVAYPCDAEARCGIVLIESKDNHSIQIPIRNLLKKCFRQVNHRSYTLFLHHYVTSDAIEEYIRQNQVIKLRLIKNHPTHERGDAMQYSQQEIVYTNPSGDGIKGVLTAFCRAHYNSRRDTGINEIDTFRPDTIKFLVKQGRVTRTYTAGNISAGLIQTDVTERVVDPDGITNEEHMLEEMKALCLQQHFSEN